jgi:FrmR/RcnR family transcriptional regulator, repressor of frmRAB operon
MAHTREEHKRLLNRARRIRGQVDVVVRALEQEFDCSDVLHAIAVCRGALDSLMAEVINGHIRYHVLDPNREPTDEQTRAAEDLIDALKMYLK